MPLDHFVSQVHLRNFYASSLKNVKMYAIRKSDLKNFPVESEDVCRIESGSTNPYLQEPRKIEEFLRDIESSYNAGILNLRNEAIDKKTIYVISGFIAFVYSCSPGGMRINKEQLEKQLDATVILLDRQGLISQAPKALGNKSLTDLLNKETVKNKVDPKFSQAIGINVIKELLSGFGNAHWEIIFNKSGSLFFTSDFPIAFEKSKDPRIVNKIIPLTPSIAVRICPDISQTRKAPDFSFPGFRCRFTKANQSVASYINRLIVQCSEDLIFFCDKKDWIRNFVKKNSYFHAGTKTQRIPCDRGFMLISRQGIFKKP